MSSEYAVKANRLWSCVLCPVDQATRRVARSFDFSGARPAGTGDWIRPFSQVIRVTATRRPLIHRMWITVWTPITLLHTGTREV
jgi:hypothetical protein